MGLGFGLDGSAVTPGLPNWGVIEVSTAVLALQIGDKKQAVEFIIPSDILNLLHACHGNVTSTLMVSTSCFRSLKSPIFDTKT
jgi:hypothetical protein